jgi:hypothetical protein
MEYEWGYNGNASGMGYSWNLNDHVGNPIPRSYKKHGGWRSISNAYLAPWDVGYVGCFGL